MPLREETTSGFFDRSTEFVDWESTDVSEQESSASSYSSHSPTMTDASSSAASTSNTTLTSAQEDRQNEPVSIQASWLKTKVVYLSAPSTASTPAYQTGYLQQPSTQAMEAESVAPSYTSSAFQSAPSVGDDKSLQQQPSSSLSSSSSSSLSKPPPPPGIARPGTPTAVGRQQQRRKNHISFPIDEEEKDSYSDEQDYYDAEQQHHSEIKSTTIPTFQQEQHFAESIDAESNTPSKPRNMLFKGFTVSSLTMPMFSSRRAGSSSASSPPSDPQQRRRTRTRIHTVKNDENALLPRKRGPRNRKQKCLLWVGLFFFVVTISLAVTIFLINPDQEPIRYLRDVFGMKQKGNDDVTVNSQVPSLHPTTTTPPSMAPVTSPQMYDLDSNSPIKAVTSTLAPTREYVRGQRTRRPSVPVQEPEAFCSGISSPTRVCQSSVECVLQSLFEQTNGCAWKENTHWLSTTAHVCDWYGIQCNYDDTPDYPQIVGLSLANNQLKGQLPSELGLLLPLLRTLQLDGNELTGPIVPSWLWSSHLEEWSVSDNSFTGTIPTEIGLMAPSLKRVNLKSNDNLVGTLPSELGFLTELTYLNLSKNYFKGTIPTELAHLSNHLEYLNVGQNVLRGTLPDDVLGQLTSLTFLSSYYNLHTGTLPVSALSRLTNLVTLDLGLCERLRGSVPTVLGTLTNLQFLALEGNVLTGTLPTELGALTDMTYLTLYGNNGMDGTIPSELGALSSLQELRLEDTQLTGSVPSQVCTLVSNGDLTEFYADCNRRVDCSCFASCCPAIPYPNGIINDTNHTNTPVAIDRTNDMFAPEPLPPPPS